MEYLDDIFYKFKFDRLDFIKMDLEGYELFADNFYPIAYKHTTTTRKYFNFIAGFNKNDTTKRFSSTEMRKELA